MPLGSFRSRFISTTAVLIATACLSVAAPASGGAFPVVACNDAPAGRAEAWSQARTAATDQLESKVVCPSGPADPYGSLQNGMGVVDRMQVYGAAPDGSYAEWRFVAPAGTGIVTARVTRDIGNRDEWTPYARLDGVDQPGETCMRGINQSFCRIQGTRTFTGLNARSIAYGVRCVTAPYCAHLWDLRAVWVLVLGATITLDDREAPTVSAVDATGLADGRWWNRSGVVAFSAQDNTGVRRRAVVVGGTVRATADAPSAAAGGCRDVGLGEAYAYARPCADARGLNGSRAMTVNPCAWGDGLHAVRGRVTDTGGLEATSSSSTAVRVDCSAPIVAVDGPGTEVVGGEPLEPVVSAADATSGLTTVEVQVRVDAGAWEPLTPPLVAQRGRAYDFRARATDVAGNWSAWTQPTERTYGVAPPAPEPSEDEADADADPPPPSGDPQPQAATAIAEPFTVEPAETTPSPVEALTIVAPREPGHVSTPSPPRQPPTLRITRVITRAGGVLEITGTAARTLDARATVTVRSNRKRYRRPTTVQDGRWRARVRTRSTARPTQIRIATPATATHAPGIAHWRRPLAHRPLQ